MKAILYTTPTCASCHMVEKFFNGRGIAYTKIDLEEAPDLRQELIDKTGYTTVPIIQWGTKFTVGYNPSKLSKLINE